jgi:hypothetical protein
VDWFGRQAALKEEMAAFYWFNSRVISDAGTSLYGRFVYQRLLPLLAPAIQNNPNAWFVLFDGDCLVDLDQLTWYFRRQDVVLLKEAKRIGESLCYVIAVLGQGTRAPEDTDRELREAKVLGYMGMMLPGFFKRDTFLRCQETMALVVAVRIDGPNFKRISYGFHSDRELEQMGFKPYMEK